MLTVRALPLLLLKVALAMSFFSPRWQEVWPIPSVHHVGFFLPNFRENHAKAWPLAVLKCYSPQEFPLFLLLVAVLYVHAKRKVNAAIRLYGYTARQLYG